MILWTWRQQETKFRLTMFMLYAAGFSSDCYFHCKVQDLPRIRKTAMYASGGGNIHACIVMYTEWVNKHAAKHVFPMVFDLSCSTENGNMCCIFLPKNVDFLVFCFLNFSSMVARNFILFLIYTYSLLI